MLTWVLGSSYTVPAIGSTINATFVDTANMWPGAQVTLEDTSMQMVMTVTSVVSSTTATLLNRYYNTRPSSHVFASGSQVFSLGFDGSTPSIRRFGAYDNIPYSTTYPAFNTRGSLGLPVLDCAQSVTTDCLFSDVMPQNANLALGLTAIIQWTAHVATAGNVKWNLAFQRLNGSIAAASFDTAGTITSATNGTIDTITKSVISITTINGITAGDIYVMKVTRDGTNGLDTMTTDLAEVCAVELRSAGT